MPGLQQVCGPLEVVKGYEYEKDQYLLFSKEELDEIEPDSAESMEFLSFVKTNEIEPVYFDSSYYAEPAEAGVRAYNLLVDAMCKTGYAGIAKLQCTWTRKYCDRQSESHRMHFTRHVL